MARLHSASDKGQGGQEGHPHPPPQQQPADEDACGESGGGDGGAGPRAFDYMAAEEECLAVEASCCSFLEQLMAETAPACQLPMMMVLIQDNALAAQIRVRGGGVRLVCVCVGGGPPG